MCRKTLEFDAEYKQLIRMMEDLSLRVPDEMMEDLSLRVPDVMMEDLSLRVPDEKTKEYWMSNTNIHLIDYLIHKHDPMMTGRKWGIALIDLVVDVQRNLGYSEHGLVFRYEGFYYLLPGDIIDNVLDEVGHKDADSVKCWLTDMWIVLENVLGRRVTHD
jgi:hypothetical protein